MRSAMATLVTFGVVLLAPTGPSAILAQSSAVPLFDIVEQDISDLRYALRDGRVTSRQLVERYHELQAAISVPSLSETADRYLEVLGP